MSNEIKKYKKCLKTVKPLLKKNMLQLDVLKNRLEKKNNELDNYKLVYDEKMLKKSELLLQIESFTDSGKKLDVNMLSNAKHYLTQVNDDLIDASSSLRGKRQAVHTAKTKLIECHVDIKLMEKYEENKKSAFNKELEKIEMHEIEDMWLQSKLQKPPEKEIVNE